MYHDEKFYQMKVDEVVSYLHELKVKIEAQGGHLTNDNRVILRDKLWVVELYTYNRTRYEDYGHSEIKRKMIRLDEDLLNRIKDIKERNDKCEMYEFLFCELFDRFGYNLSQCVEHMDESNTTIELGDSYRYINKDDFLIEYAYESECSDVYISLFKTDFETYRTFEDIDLSYSKTLRFGRMC